MTKKGSGLAETYDDLETPPPAPAGKPAKQEKVAEADGPQVIATRFQMIKSDWRRLKDISISERRSFQELLEEGLQAVFAQRGLKPLQGMPRTKNKGK